MMGFLGLAQEPQIYSMGVYLCGYFGHEGRAGVEVKTQDRDWGGGGHGSSRDINRAGRKWESD